MMKFPAHKASMTITHNEHKDYYQSVAEWARDRDVDWVSAFERKRAEESDDVWVIQWYPETPVGFCILAASDLEKLLDAASNPDYVA